MQSSILLVRLLNGVVNLSRTMAGNRALVKRVLPYLKNSVTIYDLKVSDLQLRRPYRRETKKACNISTIFQVHWNNPRVAWCSRISLWLGNSFRKLAMSCCVINLNKKNLEFWPSSSGTWRYASLHRLLSACLPSLGQTSVYFDCERKKGWSTAYQSYQSSSHGQLLKQSRGPYYPFPHEVGET